MEINLFAQQSDFGQCRYQVCATVQKSPFHQEN